MSTTRFSPLLSRLAAVVPAVAALAVCLALIDLKGISTDEGVRLGIVNGGHPARPAAEPIIATWPEVIETVRPLAYQPGYYLALNSLMRAAGRQDLLFFRLVNVACFAAGLAGLAGLSRGWPAWPRLFLFGLFAFNAYLFMHVLQIREYVAAMGLYMAGTGLVLRLDRREPDGSWADVAWFGGYGLLLAGGFYLQTWTVFPAVAQVAFLLLRRRPHFWRYAGHLLLTGVVVFALTWPYLRANRQKADVGLWAPEHVTLAGQLKQGFQLVLSGHLPGHSAFTTLLPWAWLALLAAGAGILWRRPAALPPGRAAESRRQAGLMLLSVAVPLAFQVAYFLKVEPLSVWPRYFIIHYFFLTWLIALAFRTLHDARAAAPRAIPAVLAGATALLAASAVYQVRSFARDPYFDTSLSRASDWRTGTALLAGRLRPDDVLVMHDLVTRSTLTFTAPVANRVLVIAELDAPRLAGVHRVLYLEPATTGLNAGAIAGRLAALGFGPPAVLAASPPAGSEPSFWRLVAYTRP